MRPKVQATVPKEEIGALKYGLAVVACFAIGYAAHMFAPLFMGPPTVQVPPAPPGPEAPAPAPAPKAAPVRKSFSSVELPSAGKTATVPTTQQGTLAELTACRTAIQAGKSYGGFTPDEVARFMNGGGALNAAAIKEGCRRITEGEVQPKPRG